MVFSLFAIICLSVTTIKAEKHNTHYNCSRQQVKTTDSNNNSGPSPASKFYTSNNGRTKAGAQKMEFSDWYAYNGSSLVSKLKETTDYPNQLKSLYDFEKAYGKYIFSSRNVESVAKAMYDISIAHTGDYSSGMYGLVCYLHAATYHEFFKKSVSIDDQAMRWYRLACESFTNNTNLYALTPESLSILDEFIVMVDNDKIRHKPAIISMIKKIMTNLVREKNWKQINDQSLMRSYSVMANRIYFYMFRGFQNGTVKDLINTIANDTEFFDLVAQIALDKDIASTEKLQFLQDNAIGELARAAAEVKLIPLVEGHLANIANKYERLHVNWLKCIEALNKYGDCAKFNLCKDLTALREELNNKLFPNTWSFDNGKMLIKTPLTYQQVEPLYYAAKEVEAQMYRILQTDESVLGDPNETLNMVIYGTLSDYRAYQTFLNNLSSDNGGIYIESQSTFYTYERTIQESTYSLEELFRHEYTHYLQGRYIENGFWGSTDFFKNARLTWFEEGMAEFMAGSTSSDGIRFRTSMMRNLRNDGEDRMPVNETIGANYSSGFKFYRYSYMIWLYLYKNQYQDMKILMDLIKNDDIAGFDSKVNSLKTSSSFQQKVNTFIDKWVNRSDDWWVPTTAYLPDNSLNIKSLQNIEIEFKNITGLQNISVVSDASTSISRFGIKGKLTSGKFDQELNAIIKSLNNDKYINNFDFLVGYYKNVNQNNADFYITGSLKDQNAINKTICDFEINTQVGLTGQEVVVTSTSRGYIKAYKWTAENAQIISVNDNQTKIIFPAAGKYNISLEITDNNQNKYIKTISNAVEIFDKATTQYCIPETISEYAYISSVQLADINNQNDNFNPKGYVYFSDKLSILVKGENNLLSVANSYPVVNSKTKAWIDWNQDGTFDNTEKVMDISGEGIHENTISTPLNATTGVTRMRVRFTISKELDSCEKNTYVGETHDYTIIVQDNFIIVDNEIPSTPENIIVSNINNNSALLNWTASTDNIGVKNYLIYVNNILAGSSLINSFELRNLNPSTNYNIHIVAVDTSNNKSLLSAITSFTSSDFIDNIAPSAPTYLAASEISQNSIKLNWNASTDNVEVLAYNIFMNTTKIFSGSTTNFIVNNLNADTQYTFFVKAIDNNNNVSLSSNEIRVRTLAEIDTTPPSIPDFVNVNNITESSLEIQWTASTDNQAIGEYQVFLNNNKIGTTNTTNFVCNNLLSNTNYSIQIKAVDTSYNESGFSLAVNATTLSSTNTYCHVQANNNVYEWIASVGMANFSNRSDKQKYSDFTNLESLVYPGTRTWISIEPGFISGQSYQENVRAWIDWNKDSIFDESEMIIDQTRNSSMGGWFDVPSNFSGSTRMRVMLQYGAKPEACSNITSGEIEDYTITTNRTKDAISKIINNFEYSTKANLKVYPNPCTDNITLEMPEEYIDANISIINSLGVIVSKIKADRLRKQIKTSHLPTGKYIILIQNKNKTISRHIIKN